MGQNDQAAASLVVSSRDFFQEIVTDAFDRRKIVTLAPVRGYIVDLLEFYVPTANLFDEVDSSGRKTRETLAETFLRSQTAEPMVRIELLKKLGDRSLYISGFFADSLQRKLIDVDYYADMGGMAYSALAGSVREDTLSKVYSEFARRFLEFADVLAYISTQAHLQNEENLMRLYELYARTGSEVARQKLIEKGLVPTDQVRSKKPQ
ncbi:MAG: hypothetical protein V4760_12035 [Bdellovibrionota bacterium]